MVDRCGLCGRSFDSPAALLAHINEEHPKGTPAKGSSEPAPTSESPYRCDDCGADFIAEAELTLHINRQHVGTWRQ